MKNYYPKRANTLIYTQTNCRGALGAVSKNKKFYFYILRTKHEKICKANFTGHQLKIGIVTYI